MNAPDRRPRGFTLVELMIVLVVMAVLAAIALPAYSNYGYRARRADAQKLLLAIANAEERYYAQNNVYADLATIGYATTTTATSERGYYTATVTVSTVNSLPSQGYVATATPAPQGPQARDVCTAMTISNTGLRSPMTATRNGTCW